MTPRGARGGIVAAILAAWRDPRGSIRRQLDSGIGEERVLFYLFAAAGLGFVASLPQAMRQAGQVGVELAGTIAAHLFAYLFLAPLMMYGVAALLHLCARMAGGRGRYLDARAALFWALLTGTPFVLALAALGVLAEAAAGEALEPVMTALGLAALGFWLWLLAGMLAEAEGFGRTLPVAGALYGVFAGLAALTLVMAGSGGP